MAYDQNTFKFYADNAAEYATRRTKPSKTLHEFLSALPNGANVLELGSGAGLEAAFIRDQASRSWPQKATQSLANT